MTDVGAGSTTGRRRRGRWLLALAAMVVLALVAGGVVALTRDRSTDQVVAVDVKARDAAVRTILARRAAAVLSRDQRAWLADVDPENASFRRDQGTVFANLMEVRFASWRYESIGRDFDEPDLARRYDAPYVLSPMLLHYAIKGYDPGPVARPEVLTFVERGNRWYVASDSDADDDLPATGHADPWDRRAMVTGVGKNVLVLADAQDKDRLGALVRTGDAAVARVAKMWPDGWSRKVVIVAVRDPRLLKTYFRTDAENPNDFAAVAAQNFDLVPGWTPAQSTPYDRQADPQPRSRVILNPRNFNPYSSGNADLLTHEITHVATQASTGAGAPAWLVEGAAEYTAYRDDWPLDVRLPPSLTAQVTDGSVYLPTYDFYQHDLSANYLAGLFACGYVANHYGEATLRRYYRQLAPTPHVTETGDRTERVSRAVLGLSTEQLQRHVAAYAASLGH
jgi:hypothetical protein